MPTVQPRNQDGSASEVVLPELVSRFLKARGFLNKEDQIAFLNPSLKEIKDPFVLKDMDKAVNRLCQALQGQEAVGVYCDYDLDGSSSAALLKTALTEMGFGKVVIYQPRRLLEGYGFHTQGVDHFKQEGVSLIVTADVGITAHKTCAYAIAQNIDVIVTDHHLPNDSLPQAVAVLNPNTKECPSGLGHLCGVGVAFYLIYALAKKIKEAKRTLPEGFKIEALLDFLVIGTLTDMVPLIKENRVLVKKGLRVFTQTPRAGLHFLKQKAKVQGKTINSNDIGFKIAPKLNSLSRLDTELRPTQVMLETDPQRAEVLVEEAFAVNEERKESLEQGLEETLSFFEQYPPEKSASYVSPHIHPGVMGLIATRVAEKFNCPAFIASHLKSGQVVGSARLSKNTGLSLKEILGECLSLQQYGGHAEAAGFELHHEKWSDFTNDLKLVFNRVAFQLEGHTFEYKYDCEALLSELDGQFLSWLKHLEPFGVGFSVPEFKLSGLDIVSVKKLKELHYKIIVSGGGGNHTAEMLWFFPPEDHEVASLLDSNGFWPHKFNAYVSPNVNFFREVETLQLLVNDIEVLL